MPHPTDPEITIVPIEHPPGSKVNYGAIVTGADLNNLSDAELEILRKAIYTHKVIVLKGQEHLLPAKQFEFVQRLDPDASGGHGTGSEREFKKSGGVLSKRPVYRVPGAENVRMVGAGYQGADHFGLKDITITPLSHRDFHASPLSADDMQQGFTRFQRWHIDGAFYGASPSRVTTLRCLAAPRGPDLTLRWDDGSGATMKIRPGRTAFFSGAQLYGLLSPAEKALVEHSSWEAAPHPFVWTGASRTKSIGLGLLPPGPGADVLPLEELPAWDEGMIQRHPMVWVNPETGEKSLQVHDVVARKLYLKDGRDGAVRVVDDLKEVRSVLNGLLERIVRPEYIFVPPSEEGDVVCWTNWAVMHTAVEYPASYGPRIMHQTHIASSTPPLGPAV